MCGHDLPFFVSRHGRFVFLLALQYQPNWQWFSNLCGLLHLMHLDPWILQENVECLYFQQFLYCRMPEFILASLMVVIYFPILKHWLIKVLALLSLWTSQMSIQIIDISNFSDTLMTCSFEASITLLKIWFCLMMFSTSLEVR